MLHPLRMGAADVVGRNRRTGFGLMGAKGIEPGMQLQATAVRLFDGESERIVERGRRPAHLPCQILRPGFERRRINGVAAWADLEDDGVEAETARLNRGSQQLPVLR